MTEAERWLRRLLRINGVILLLAFPAVVMPVAWMNGVHQWLQMGPLPDTPLVGYLTRSISLLYGVVGLATLVLASDIVRYGPLITLWGWACLGCGLVLGIIDLACGLPWAWTLVEAPYLMPLGLVVLWLRRRVTRHD